MNIEQEIDDILEEFFIEAQDVHDEYDRTIALEVKEDIFARAKTKLIDLMVGARIEELERFTNGTPIKTVLSGQWYLDSMQERLTTLNSQKGKNHDV